MARGVYPANAVYVVGLSESYQGAPQSQEVEVELMPKVIVYQNPNFLSYQGNHSQIVQPTEPVATVTVPEGVSLTERLAFAYAQTQHANRSWFDNPQVMAHLRSTSVGDLMADSDGSLYVVEPFGFEPYQPKAIDPVYKLAEAYRLLETACTERRPESQDEVAVDEADAHSLLGLVRQALGAAQNILVAEEYRVCESAVIWNKAQSGDLVGNLEIGQYRIIARRLRPKWRAKRLLAHIPNAQIWVDSPRILRQAQDRLWAVLVPVKQEV